MLNSKDLGKSSDKDTGRSTDIQSGIEEIKKLQDDLVEILSSQKNQVSLQELGDEYVNRIIDILQIASNLVPIRKGKNTEYGLNVLKRFQSIYDLGGENKIFCVDQLLYKFINTVEERLSVDVVELPFSIYPPNHIPEIEEGEDSGKKFSERELASFRKYKTLLHILHARGISFDNLIVLEENQELLQSEKRMRKLPYKIIYLQDGDVSKTILISDEIGQATFIYEGLIREDNFSEYSKGDMIEGIIPERITFGKTYGKRLEKAIFESQAISNNDSIYLGSSEEINTIKEKTIYRNMLWGYLNELQEAGIHYIDGVWFFGSAVSALKWPKIQGKTLRSFPNLGFNRKSKVGNPQGQIQSSIELSKLFSMLGFKVASSQEEQNRLIKIWKNTIISNREILKSAGVIEQDGVWFFGKVTAMKFWPKVDDKKLRNFPNASFIKEQLGEEHESILNGEQLRIIFSAIGLKIATPEEEKIKFKKDSVEILMGHLPELSSIGIEYDDGIWKIGDLSSDILSLEIGGIKLRNFPNIGFNRDHNIGGNDGRLGKNKQDLKKVLEILDQKVEIIN